MATTHEPADGSTSAAQYWSSSGPSPCPVSIAMREMAACTEDGLIGCTQATEIRYTPGVDFVGLLPPAFELATVYTAAVATASAQAALAQRFIALMAGVAVRPLREAGGFE